MKPCAKCGENPRRKKNSSYCTTCHNSYMKQWYRDHPRSTLASAVRSKEALKDAIRDAKNAPCADCKEKYPYYVMDFDHCRGKKLLNLSTAANKMLSMRKLKAEIKKCDVVCANCHRERTARRDRLKAGRCTLKAAI